MSDTERLSTRKMISQDAIQSSNRNDLSWQVQVLTEAVLLLVDETRQSNVLLSEMIRRDRERS